MFDHPIIDVALGLILIYIILSLICSAVQEWVASLTRIRSRNLEAGIRNLLDGPDSPVTEYAAKVYAHPLIKNLAKKDRLPSYIPSDLLSTVLLDVLASDSKGKSYRELNVDEVWDMIKGFRDDQPVKQILISLALRSNNRVEELRNELADWIDAGMERVSGWYARATRLWLFGIAVVVTIALNANTLTMIERIWQNDNLRDQLSAQAVTTAQSGEASTLEETRDELSRLPLGWRVEDGEVIGDESSWLLRIIGWLITVSAISLGAPFWFDLLGKVARLRGAGGKPGKRSATA